MLKAGVDRDDRGATWYQTLYWRLCLVPLRAPGRYLSSLKSEYQGRDEKWPGDNEDGLKLSRFSPLSPAAPLGNSPCLLRTFCSPSCLPKTGLPAKQPEQQGWAAVSSATAVSLSGITLLSGHEECVLPLECFPCGHAVSGRGILSSAEKAFTVHTLMRNNSCRKCIMQDCKLRIFIQSEMGLGGSQPSFVMLKTGLEINRRLPSPSLNPRLGCLNN